MSCLGVLFALTKQDVESLLEIKDEEQRLDMLKDVIEEKYFDEYPEYTAEFDKSWDAIHRVMTDGYFDLNNGTFPLSHVIMGGQSLYEDDDYFMILKTPEEVELIWQALQGVTEEWFRERYFMIDSEDYGFDVDEDDFRYSWQWFCYSLPAWELAAKEKRYMLFTVDQ
ncbi:DUF1877 family protein [Myroides odoratimimus]|uniref:DUF1877 family protein n=1 Tax=Myroides odoratimimus TaxID=76832 RepID=UPI0038D37C53